MSKKRSLTDKYEPSLKKIRLEVHPLSTWNCGRCSSVNSMDSFKCLKCIEQHVEDTSWTCWKCTMINNIGDSNCSICEAEDDELTESGDDNEPGNDSDDEYIVKSTNNNDSRNNNIDSDDEYIVKSTNNNDSRNNNILEDEEDEEEDEDEYEDEDEDEDEEEEKKSLIDESKMDKLNVAEDSNVFVHYFVKSWESDQELSVTNMYGGDLATKMKHLISKTETPSFLYSFIRYGIGIITDCVDYADCKDALKVENMYYDLLNYKLGPAVDIRGPSQMDYREYTLRGKENADPRYVTMDLSLSAHPGICPFIKKLLRKCTAVQQLQHFYENIYENKKMQFAACGFFQSKFKNEGQIWHVDLEETDDSEHTVLSPVVTVIIALTNQEANDLGQTTGSTIFSLGSHHATQYVGQLDFGKIIQPLFEIGDVACFAANIWHRGGPFNFKNRNDRVLVYGVLHLTDKNARKNYLAIDKNILKEKSKNTKKLLKYKHVNEKKHNNFVIDKKLSSTRMYDLKL